MSRRSRNNRSSSTPGKQKGQNCQKSELKNLFCNDTKLHRTNPKLWMACVLEIQKVQRDKGVNLTLQELVKREE